MPFYEFRADTRTREIPRFGEKQRTRLEEILNIRFDSCTPDLGTPVPLTEKKFQRFQECQKKQCLFGIQTASSDVEVTMGMLVNSSSVVIKIDHQCAISENQIEDLRKELFMYFESPDSITIKDLNPDHIKIAQNREIPGPSVYFASGIEWYKYVSPMIWQEHYDRNVVLDAPIKVKILQNGFLEWYAYDNLLHFDIEAVTANRIYFGEHRKLERSLG